MAFRKEALVDCIDLTLNGGSAPLFEIDIGLNVRKKGFQVFYDTEAIVDHYPAPRKIDVQRGWNPKQCFWYAHNLTYICLKHLRWYGKLAFLFYFFVGGQWGCPALITYILGVIRGRPPSWRQQFLPSLKGRLTGIRFYAEVKYKKKACLRKFFRESCPVSVRKREAKITSSV